MDLSVFKEKENLQWEERAYMKVTLNLTFKVFEKWHKMGLLMFKLQML